MGLIKRRWKILIAALLPVQILLVAWASHHPQWVESYYSQGLYPRLSWAIRSVSRLLPIPIGQLIFYSLIALILAQLFRFFSRLRKRETSPKRLGGRLLFDLAYFGSILYFLFMVSWGLNYQRVSVVDIAQLDVDEVQADELVDMCSTLVELCNVQRSNIHLRDGELPLTDGEILSKAPQGFANVPSTHKFLEYSHPSVKSVYVPKLMSSFGIGGIYFMFTGEANVNMDPPNFLVPATTCHEMAHQLGFASEDEANFIGYLATQFNPDKHFNYSGNLMALRYSMRSLYRADSARYNTLREKISDDVLSDIRVTREYWTSFDNPLDPLSDAVYDAFLKANSQKAGIASYSQVVRLFVGEYRKERFGFAKPGATRTSGSP